MLDLLIFYPYDNIFFLDLLIFLLELLILLLNVAISIYSQDFCLQFLNTSVSYLKDIWSQDLYTCSIIIKLR